MAKRRLKPDVTEMVHQIEATLPDTQQPPKATTETCSSSAPTVVEVNKEREAMEGLFAALIDDAQDPGTKERLNAARAYARQGYELAVGEAAIYQPLPIIGERGQPADNISTVNRLRQVAEQVAGIVRSLATGADQLSDTGERAAAMRWVALGRTDLERGFMFLERSVLRPLGGFGRP